MGLVAGGFFSDRYKSINTVVEEGSRFDPNRVQGQVGSIFSLYPSALLINYHMYWQSFLNRSDIRIPHPNHSALIFRIFVNRFWKESYFEALASIRLVAEKYNLTMAEIALRWIGHHSILKREYGDSILIGASSLKHVEQVCCFFFWGLNFSNTNNHIESG